MQGELEPAGTYGGGGDVLGGIGAIVGAGASIYNTVATNKANKKMAEYQYSKDLEMWNLANTYNSPQAQMQRLQQAGLNPNLIYGQGGGAGGQAAQLPKYQAPRMEYNFQPPDLAAIPNMIMAFQDMKLKQAQYDNLKAQRKAIEVNTAQKEFGLNWNQEFRKINENILVWKNQQASNQTSLQEQKLRQQEELFPHQLQYMQGKNRAQELSMNKVAQATEFEKMKMDWYETQMISSIGGAAATMFGKLRQSLFKGARGTRSMQVPGKTLNQSKRGFDETTRRMKEFGKRLK